MKESSQKEKIGQIVFSLRFHQHRIWVEEASKEPFPLSFRWLLMELIDYVPARDPPLSLGILRQIAKQYNDPKRVEFDDDLLRLMFVAFLGGQACQNNCFDDVDPKFRAHRLELEERMQRRFGHDEPNQSDLLELAHFDQLRGSNSLALLYRAIRDALEFDAPNPNPVPKLLLDWLKSCLREIFEPATSSDPLFSASDLLDRKSPVFRSEEAYLQSWARNRVSVFAKRVADDPAEALALLDAALDCVRVGAAEKTTTPSRSKQ